MKHAEKLEKYPLFIYFGKRQGNLFILKRAARYLGEVMKA